MPHQSSPASNGPFPTKSWSWSWSWSWPWLWPRVCYWCFVYICNLLKLGILVKGHLHRTPPGLLQSESFLFGTSSVCLTDTFQDLWECWVWLWCWRQPCWSEDVQQYLWGGNWGSCCCAYSFQAHLKGTTQVCYLLKHLPYSFWLALPWISGTMRRMT